VGFFDGQTSLRKVAVTGGPAVTIAPVDGNGPRGATWGSDGAIVYATNGTATGLQRGSDAGGDPEILTKPDRERGEADHIWPEFLPGGRSLLFTILPAGGQAEATQIAVLDLATRRVKVVLRGGSHGYYVPSGHLVYGVGGTMRAVAFDLDRLEVVTTPAPVIDAVVMASAGLNASIAANGTLVYVSGGPLGFVRSLVWVDRQGREEPVAAPPRVYAYPRISPDGTRVALQNRLEALLEEAHIKLSSLVTDLLGPSARRMLQAVADGATDPAQVAALAHQRMRATPEALSDALGACRTLHPVYRRLLGLALTELRGIEEQIAALNQELAGLLRAHQDAVERLAAVPGFGVDSAQQIIAEVGPRAMTFPSGKHLSSWVGACPGAEESAGVNYSRRPPKGNRQMRRLLTTAANAAVKTKGSIFEHLYRRWVRRLGHGQAIGAIAHVSVG
jgi:hypothetical protein